MTRKTPGVRYIATHYGRHGRHRSPQARTTTNGLEPIRPCSMGIDAATVGRIRPWLDVEARVERRQDKLQIDVERPVDASKPHHQCRIFELLRHGASQLTRASHPDAKNTARSKLPGSGHDLGPHACPRGGTRRLEAHRLRKLRPWHARALLAVSRHGWGTSWAAAAMWRARSSSWHLLRWRRGAHERPEVSCCKHDLDGRRARSPARASTVWVPATSLPSGSFSQ